MNEFFTRIRDFLTEYLPNQRCAAANTIRSYRQALNLFVSHLRDQRGLNLARAGFADIDRAVVAGFLDWLEEARDCSASTRNQRLMALRAFFDYAAMMDCAQMALSLEIKTVPAKKTTGKVVDFLSEDALRALLAQPDPAKPTGLRNQVFMITMYDTAARCAEMLDLRVRDLRLDTAHPVAYLHGKGGKTRIVPLLPKTVEHLKRHRRRLHPGAAQDSEDLVFFTTAHGQRQPMSPDAVAAFFKTYGDQARRQCPEIPNRCHPHQLRHTRAIHLYRQGMPLPLLSEYLGHASVESTKIYAYADSEMKRAAIEKADALRGGQAPPPRVWEGDEDMILRLAGLT